MRTRLIVALAAAAGFAAAAQAQPDEFIFTWQVNAFDVSSGAIVSTNVSQLESGQGAEFVASWSFTPEIGTIRTNHHGHTGPVAGFGKVFGDFNAGPNHRGTFAPATASGLNLHYLFHPGDVEPDRVRAIQQSPFGSPPPIHPHSFMDDAFRIRWMPADWDVRTVDFEFVKGVDTSVAAELLINIDPSSLFGYGTYRIGNEHFRGGSIQLQIVPAPASALLLGLGALITARRRR